MLRNEPSLSRSLTEIRKSPGFNRPNAGDPFTMQDKTQGLSPDIENPNPFAPLCKSTR